jgi:hypothetical protein
MSMGYFEDRVREGMENPEYRRGWYEAKLELLWESFKGLFRFERIRGAIRVFKGLPEVPPPPLEGWEHRNAFRGILEQTATGWSAYIEGVPGIGVAFDTREQCMDDLSKAFKMHREWYSVYPGPYLLYFTESTFPCTVSIGMPYLYETVG